ncbi:hypothetical protein ACIRYZ_16395 [Kitasatospora sp. NPDC101155]|uniref:hypothetical protein n=1 Tax=Kitasatospora sp. NPDC101155 TaxID=3364097 RepID=UPI003807943B
MERWIGEACAPPGGGGRDPVLHPAVLWRHAPAAGQPAGRRSGAAAPGPLLIESDDLRADFEVLRERGVVFEQPEPEDYGFGVRIETVDPDGNRTSLRQRAAWQGGGGKA